jgi:hypothetical protein
MSELTVAERAMPELTDDMTVDVLEHMRFASGQATTVRIRGVRDYLVRMMRGRADRSAPARFLGRVLINRAAGSAFEQTEDLSRNRRMTEQSSRPTPSKTLHGIFLPQLHTQCFVNFA